MPPHRKDSAGTESAASGGGGRPRRVGNAILVDRALPTNLQHDLETILERREALERKLAEIDERVYDLESEYLRGCVELGGSLFDGYGVERASFLNSGTNYLFGSPTSTGSGGGRGIGSAVGYTNFPGSPSSSSGAGVLSGGTTSAFAAVMAGAGANSATEASAMAFRARTQNFTPSERIFSSASVGAIERVAQAKAMRAAAGTLRSTAGGGGAGRGRGGSTGWGMNSDGSRGIMTRRRSRHTGEEEEEGSDGGDNAAATRGGGRRRARGE